jgi:hypothetical protein
MSEFSLTWLYVCNSDFGGAYAFVTCRIRSALDTHNIAKQKDCDSWSHKRPTHILQVIILRDVRMQNHSNRLLFSCHVHTPRTWLLRKPIIIPGMRETHGHRRDPDDRCQVFALAATPSPLAAAWGHSFSLETSEVLTTGYSSVK